MHRQFRLAVQLIPVMSPRAREVHTRRARRSLTVSGWREIVPKFQSRWNLGIANWNLGTKQKARFQFGIPVFTSYVKLFQFGTQNWNFAKSLIYKENFMYNLWITC
jgi:hypothetical protein